MIRSRKCRAYLGQGGFTLLEIIVTIVIAAIMGVFFAQFVYTGVIHSADPVRQVQNMSHCHPHHGVHDCRLQEARRHPVELPGHLQGLCRQRQQKKPAASPAIPYYGIYDIVYNNYVIFDRGHERRQTAGPTEQKILKVTIRRGNQTVTALFTR